MTVVLQMILGLRLPKLVGLAIVQRITFHLRDTRDRATWRLEIGMAGRIN
jgi:hypothetical protein